MRHPDGPVKALIIGLALCGTALVAWPLVVRGRTSRAPLEAATSAVCLLQVSNYPVGSDALADASMFAWSLYATRHGYRYVRVIEQSAMKGGDDWQTRKCSISWCKGSAVQRLLPQCQVLALLDVDVTMTDWGTPLKQLMTMWNFTESSSVLMPWDPDMPFNYVQVPGGSASVANASRLLSANTGFMLFRNGPNTFDILQRWLTCPEAMPGCGTYRHSWPCDQGAWNKFIRPSLAPRQLVMVPCSDANSFPGALPKDTGNCTAGRFVQHYWFEKHRLLARWREEYAEASRQAVLASLERGAIEVLP